MLITIIGDDFKKKSKKVKNILADLEQKKPDANFVHYDFLDLDKKKLSEIIETTGGLFEKKNIYFLSNIFYNNSKNKIKDLFLEKITEIEKSENAFVLSLEKATPSDEKKLKESSLIFEKYQLMKGDFNIFLLSDFLQNKNVKKLWLNYHLALKNNLAPEQIYANLFFALKTLTVAERFNQEKSGIKNFPYQKAKTALRFWAPQEAEKKLLNLIHLYNNSRQSGLNLENALEKFILDLN